MTAAVDVAGAAPAVAVDVESPAAVDDIEALIAVVGSPGKTVGCV